MRRRFQGLWHVSRISWSYTSIVFLNTNMANVAKTMPQTTHDLEWFLHTTKQQMVIFPGWWWVYGIVLPTWSFPEHRVSTGSPQTWVSLARKRCPGRCGQSLLHLGGPVKSSEKSTGNPSVTLPWFWPFLVVRWAPVTCSTEKALTL